MNFNFIAKKKTNASKHTQNDRNFEREKNKKNTFRWNFERKLMLLEIVPIQAFGKYLFSNGSATKLRWYRELKDLLVKET